MVSTLASFDLGGGVEFVVVPKRFANTLPSRCARLEVGTRRYSGNVTISRISGPVAAGAYRAEAFTESGNREPFMKGRDSTVVSLLTHFD